MNPSPPTRHAGIDVHRLTHRYAAVSGPRRGKHNPPTTRTALNNLTFQVEPATVFGVLGPNGSGKSTLFRILATLLRPTGGSARIFGHDVMDAPMAVRHRIGVMFQSPSIDLQLTASENLSQQGHMYGLKGRVLRKRVGMLLDHFNLHDRRDELLHRFSGGMRRRLELAKVLVHEPSLLLLDEPSTGLDPATRRGMWGYLEDLRQTRGLTVALTTHLMEDATRCTDLMILDEGHAVAVDTPANMTSLIRERVVHISPMTAEDLSALLNVVEAEFGPWPPTKVPAIVEGCIRFEHRDGTGVVTKLASDYPGRIRAFNVAEPGLEDVFLHLTGNRFSRLGEGSSPPATTR